jgi:hypothetical protein
MYYFGNDRVKSRKTMEDANEIIEKTSKLPSYNSRNPEYGQQLWWMQRNRNQVFMKTSQ